MDEPDTCHLESTAQVKPADLGQAPTVCGRNLGDTCRGQTWRAPDHLCRQTRISNPRTIPDCTREEWDGTVGRSQALNLLCMKNDSFEWTHSGTLPRGGRLKFIGKQKFGSVRGSELGAAGPTLSKCLEMGVVRHVRGAVVWSECPRGLGEEQWFGVPTWFGCVEILF